MIFQNCASSREKKQTYKFNVKHNPSDYKQEIIIRFNKLNIKAILR